MIGVVLPLLAILCLVSNTRAAEVVYGYEDESKNLVRNWDFEDDISKGDWRIASSTGTKVVGGHTGTHCLLVDQRSTKRGGPYQDISGTDLKKNTNYYLSAHVKILSRPADPDPYVHVAAFVRVVTADGSVEMLHAGSLRYVMPGGDWLQFGGDVKMPDQDMKSARLLFEVTPIGTEFMVDTVSFIELERKENWREELDAQIDEHRKAPIKVTGNLGPDMDPSQVKVKVELSRHEFGFGTAIKADSFNSGAETQTKYRDFILKHFNWIVFENDMKWKPMEKAKGSISFDRVDKALETLLALNKTIRGHALLWDVDKTNPLWVQDESGQTLRDEAQRRIQYVLERYRGKVFEWDVCNEYLHQHFFEFGTGQWNLLEEEFRLARQYDPSTDLCLNDYQIARGGGVLASNQVNVAKALLAKGAPCDCIGIQSHLQILPIDPEALQKRLQITATARLPITITEFSAHTPDVAVRADTVDKAFRIYFANPWVRGIVIWGFTDQFSPFANDHFLTEGTDFTPNAAGEKLLDLIENEWHTSEPVDVSGAGRVSGEFRGFRGNYKLTVTEAGAIVHEQDFYVGAGGATVNLAV